MVNSGNTTACTQHHDAPKQQHLTPVHLWAYCSCAAQVGTWYPLLQQQYTAVTGDTWAPGSNVGIYRNTQRPTTLWYHDHT